MMMQIVAKTILLILIVMILVACQMTNHMEETANESMVEQKTGTENIKVMEQAHMEHLPEEFKQIHEKGKLKIAMYSEDRFPYFFVNEQGELVGSDVEMAYDIAHQIGVRKVEFDRSAKTYDEIIDLVV